jgi:transposase
MSEIHGTKEKRLRELGVFNRGHARVSDPLFQKGSFFDARDVLQVRYEMVRHLTADRRPVRDVAQAFGVTRPTVYAANRRFQSGGILALRPDRPGPRTGRKLKQEHLEFLVQCRVEAPSASLSDLAQRLEERFGVSAHPSTILRALLRHKKKPAGRKSPHDS